GPDLPEARGDGAQRAVRGNQCVERGLRVEVIRRLLDRKPCGFREARGYGARVLRVRVEACPDGRAAERDARQLVDGAERAAHRLIDLTGVALELLAQADRRRVLEVGAAGLDD